MGRLKQLLPWAGTTLVNWQCRQLRDAGCEPVAVIVGHEADQVRAALEASREDGPVPVENLFYHEGRASSVRSAAEFIAYANQSLPAGLTIQGIVILSVDQPRPAWVTRRLIEASADSTALVFVPSFGGHKSHPVLLDGALLEELQAVDEETLGLRAVLVRHAGETAVIELTDGPAPFDLDLNTPADYERALVSLNREEWQEHA
jgi:CTP:molybdopterin cytidylyltransferase MocA